MKKTAAKDEESLIKAVGKKYLDPDVQSGRD
jgi:hypothetical protein